MFSSRLPATLAPNLVSQAVAALRQSGAPLLDLTETNPTVVGLPYPDDVLASLSDPRARVYAPDPRGLAEARAAIAAEYASRAAIPPDRIVLTSSSSEAYATLFKLLCNPGESVLVPHPSYPLFELLTGLEGVERAALRARLPRRVVDRSRQPRAGDRRRRARRARREPEQSDGIDASGR